MEHANRIVRQATRVDYCRQSTGMSRFWIRTSLSKVLTMSDLMDDSLAPSRFRSALMDGFALFAMALAALGVYGIMA